MRRKVMSAVVVGFALAAMVIFGGNGVAAADGRTCNSLARHCVNVLGSGTYVTSVKGSATWPDACLTAPYHFELWGGNWHHNTPDRVHSGGCWPSGVDSGWLTLNRSFPNQTPICSRLWVNRGGSWWAPYPQACLTVHV